MSSNAYRRPPGEIDMIAAERAIRRGSTLATIIALAGFLAGFWVAPQITTLPTDLSERLAFAALCWAVPCFVLLISISMVSTARRFSPDDIGGQAARPPSDKLAIKAAFLQNTLEQTVLAGGFYFALAAVAGGAWLALLPVAAFLFVIGRILFYRGYAGGVEGRALGMAMTMMPSALGFPLLAGLALFAG